MVRVCPERDAICPHGMACPYWRDRYSCESEGLGSREPGMDWKLSPDRPPAP
jgi:hypothetical protein